MRGTRYVFDEMTPVADLATGRGPANVSARATAFPLLFSFTTLVGCSSSIASGQSSALDASVDAYRDSSSDSAGNSTDHGTDDGPAETAVSGTYDGKPLSSRMFAAWLRRTPESTRTVVLVDTPIECSDLSMDALWLERLASGAVVVAIEFGAATAGTFTAGTSEAPTAGEARVFRTRASSPEPPVEYAASGRATLSALPSGEQAGTFDVVFGTTLERLEGRFTAGPCDVAW